ncbi:hypothetical protein DPMN_156527 [Dreissena polymorpha]|uniref:Uncharacterized protein n=1 Tax=Dreissena polymorpha TaxID=45954 RepID=A0A9D4JCG1_DREPO|nr:hypothetical protein DPMN_156527 [Dreissena polymorpha]
MPPKSVIKLDKKQQTLSQLLRSDSGEHEVSETNTDKEFSNDNSPKPSGIQVSKRTRDCFPKWLTMYSWLRFVDKTDEQDNFMYGSIC